VHTLSLFWDFDTVWTPLNVVLYKDCIGLLKILEINYWDFFLFIFVEQIQIICRKI
jgi:hypothetical protein